MVTSSKGKSTKMFVMVSKWRKVFASCALSASLLGSQVYPVSAVAQPAQAGGGNWSAWQTYRDYFEFQFKTSEVSPGILVMRTRIRMNAEAVANRPHLASDRFFLQYYQAISPESAGGNGRLTADSPRKIVFPTNAPSNCVYEDPVGLFAPIDPPGASNRLYVKPGFSFPVVERDGQMLSGVLTVMAFGPTAGPESIARFTDRSLASYHPAC